MLAVEVMSNLPPLCSLLFILLPDDNCLAAALPPTPSGWGLTGAFLFLDFDSIPSHSLPFPVLLQWTENCHDPHLLQALGHTVPM